MLLLLLGACGGGDEDTSAAPGSSEPATDGDSGSSNTDSGNGDSGDTGSGDGGSSSGVNACDLLTIEDVEAHFGDAAEFDDGVEDAEACTFTAIGATGSLGMAQVQFHGDAALDLGFGTFVEMISGATGSTNTEEISGLGDEAYVSEGGLMTLVFVLTGDDVLVSGVLGAEDDTAAAKDLAARALGRL